MMDTIIYRQLRFDECERIREINASQYIYRAWREVDGARQLVEINYQDTDYPDGYENHLAALKRTIKSGGSAQGAFCNMRLIGFCTVNPEVFGKTHKYVLLDQIFISLEFRGKGIGKQLFLQSVDAAKKFGAEKLYICAGSSEETIAFYRALGCTEAVEINQELYMNDTRDIQMEYTFTGISYNTEKRGLKQQYFVCRDGE